MYPGELMVQSEMPGLLSRSFIWLCRCWGLVLLGGLLGFCMFLFCLGVLRFDFLCPFVHFGDCFVLWPFLFFVLSCWFGLVLGFQGRKCFAREIGIPGAQRDTPLSR